MGEEETQYGADLRSEIDYLRSEVSDLLALNLRLVDRIPKPSGVPSDAYELPGHEKLPGGAYGYRCPCDACEVARTARS